LAVLVSTAIENRFCARGLAQRRMPVLGRAGSEKRQLWTAYRKHAAAVEKRPAPQLSGGYKAKAKVAT
jgi:hypothetical protein